MLHKNSASINGMLQTVKDEVRVQPLQVRCREGDPSQVFWWKLAESVLSSCRAVVSFLRLSLLWPFSGSGGEGKGGSSGELGGGAPCP